MDTGKAANSRSDSGTTPLVGSISFPPSASPLYTPSGVYASLARPLHVKNNTDPIAHRENATHEPKAKKRRARRQPISRALRKTIRERDLTTCLCNGKGSRVSVDAVQQFAMNAERGLTLATVDKLADALDLTLCPQDDSATGRGHHVKEHERAHGWVPKFAALGESRAARFPFP